MNLQKRSELNFYWLLLQVLAGRGPLADLVSHPVFLDRGQRICRYLARGTSYEPEELFQDLCLKLLSSGAMPRLDKTPNENAYFRWLLVLVLNMRRDYFRGNGKFRRQEVPLSDILPEVLYVADPGLSPELEARLNEFAALAETLPENTQRVIKLRQEGLTYEEIARILTSDGIKCSDVTVRKWFRDSLDAFFDCGKRATAGKTLRRAV